jgi:hypothetical protein
LRFGPGQVAGGVAHLDPVAIAEHDFDRHAARRDKQLAALGDGASYRTTGAAPTVLKSNAELPRRRPAAGRLPAITNGCEKSWQAFGKTDTAEGK